MREHPTPTTLNPQRITVKLGSGLHISHFLFRGLLLSAAQGQDHLKSGMRDEERGAWTPLKAFTGKARHRVPNLKGGCDVICRYQGLGSFSLHGWSNY